ncbi:DMT family transporter [Parvularcula flava]|uniref:DMT family transporter n=1 Tax=Aquisalinus luteolus TaxID=1566827 RepID=A0A8J3ETE4_9PROT|nr:DMT family transporter [Aquisalinus luteolus]NHK26861.1 DMT family transporter [Aquisalinus luteolus]GGH93637.1 hypothetical protein GCM10011355_05940 [Aquisalinus luteolus]
MTDSLEKTEQPATATARPAEPSLRDWLLLGLLTLIGGASFAGIKLAVATALPGTVSAGRLWAAAAFLLIYAYATGRHLPAFLRREEGKGWTVSTEWRFMMAGGVIGYAIPFTLFPFAQQTVSSMLAGIYMAFMPLVTIILARIFADEELTVRKVTGFMLGTTGVIFLIGPAAIANILSADVIAQGAMILAVICYAIYAVLTRRAPEMQARSFAAGVMLSSAVAASPFALVSGQDWGAVSAVSWLSILFLGLFPSAIAAILIITLIRKAGAGFMALTNYATPVVAIIIGMSAFGEPLKPTFIAGLVAILIGLAISRTKQISFGARGLQRLIRPRR